MKLRTLKNDLSKYIYIEDPDVVDVVLAAALSSTALHQGNPVWMVVVGASSSGKTQFINPLEHAQPAGQKTIHQVTDLTPNTFLSGYKSNDYDPSLLHQVGEEPGMLLFPDLTSLFSKEPQALSEVLGQLRHVYDGHLIKHTGNGPPLEWHGTLGVVAASTASIYAHFERFSEMGERFLYYRMKPYDRDQALETAMSRRLYGKALDEKVGEMYGEYLRHVVQTVTTTPKFSKEDNDAISEMAKIASLIRTPVHTDQYSGLVDRIPEPEMPMRTALQLRTLAMGMMVMNVAEYGTSQLTDANHRALMWCALSLADDERRATLATLATYSQGATAASIGHTMRLPSSVAERYLQKLRALGIVDKYESGAVDTWHIVDPKIADAIRAAHNIETIDTAFNVENTFEIEAEF